jgi:hypothetical protein
MHDYDAICVVRPNELPENLASAPFDVTDANVIRRLFDAVYFDVEMDGRELGVRVNAHVLARRGDEIVRYDVCGAYSYLLRHGRWAEMHPIADDGRDVLRELAGERQPAGPELRRCGVAPADVSSANS